MNADNYYLQITEDGVQHETKLDDGTVMTYYSYMTGRQKVQMVKRYYLNSRHKKIFEKTLT